MNIKLLIDWANDASNNRVIETPCWMLKKRLVLSRSVVVGNILADVNLNEYADTLPHNQT